MFSSKAAFEGGQGQRFSEDCFPYPVAQPCRSTQGGVLINHLFEREGRTSLGPSEGVEISATRALGESWYPLGKHPRHRLSCALVGTRENREQKGRQRGIL